MAETGFGPCPDHKQRPRPPSSTVFDAHPTVSAAAHIISTRLGMGTRYAIFFLILLQHSAQESPGMKHSLSRRLTLEWTTPKRTVRGKYERRRLHTTQSTKIHEIFGKPMSLNGKHLHTLWVSHLILRGLTSISATAVKTDRALDKS